MAPIIPVDEVAAPITLRGRETKPSDGWVIQASVLARLLGIRLLRLDARLDVAPAAFESETFMSEAFRPEPPTLGGLDEAEALLRHAIATLAQR
jgi:hypothetical protein